MRNQRQHYAERVQREGLTPPDAATLEYLRLIVDEGTLGASRHVELTGELFVHLADGAEPEAAWRRIRLAGDFIAETRGGDTPIIANSVRWLLAGLDGEAGEERLAALRERTRSWAAEAAARLERLVAVGVARLAGADTLLAFDYSSTVAAVVKGVHAHGRGVAVVVPESRAIDGGAPYLQEFTAAGIAVRYIVDMAIEHHLREVDAVLLGVESLRCDGSFLNTVGSRLTARCARDLGAAVYGCSDLYKLDLRSYAGHLKTPALKSFDARLLDGRELPAGARVDTSAPELEVVPAALHDGFISDLGLLPPASVWSAGRELFPEEGRDA